MPQCVRELYAQKMQFRKVALITLKLFSNIILDTKLFPRSVNGEKTSQKNMYLCNLKRSIIYYCTRFCYFLHPVGTVAWWEVWVWQHTPWSYENKNEPNSYIWYELDAKHCIVNKICSKNGKVLSVKSTKPKKPICFDFLWTMNTLRN